MPTRILSNDGGTRGLFPATHLQQPENDLCQKATDLFDFINGRATNGLISSKITTALPIDQIQTCTQTKSEIIFFIQTP